VEKIEKSMREIVTRQHTLWEQVSSAHLPSLSPHSSYPLFQTQYQSLYPEEDTAPPAPGSLSMNRSVRKAIIDKAESLVLNEFTSQSHRKEIDLERRTSSKPPLLRSRYSTFQSFSLDPAAVLVPDSEGDEQLPEDNITPYLARDSVEASYIARENEKVSQILKEQVLSPFPHPHDAPTRPPPHRMRIVWCGTRSIFAIWSTVEPMMRREHLPPLSPPPDLVSRLSYLETLRYGEDPLTTTDPSTALINTTLPILLHVHFFPS
jgi:hypothetical protein